MPSPLRRASCRMLVRLPCCPLLSHTNFDKLVLQGRFQPNSMLYVYYSSPLIQTPDKLTNKPVSQTTLSAPPSGLTLWSVNHGAAFKPNHVFCSLAQWCALASPKCGSFKSLTQNALLPSLTSITAAYNSGKSQLEALGGESVVRGLVCW